MKITKALGSGAPSAANSTEYKFNVTGPDGYSKTITIKGAGSFTITGLTPGNYKVTEDKASANITNYDLEVTGGGNVEVKAGEIAESKITNTYKDNSSQVDTGSLTVSKVAVDASENPITGSFKFSVKNSEGKYLQQNEKDFDTSIYLFLGANAPASASSKTYTFMVTGPNNYSKTVTIEGAGEEKIEGLVPGTYTVTEDTDDAEIDGYDLEVTGGGEVNVVAKDTAETTVTNTYTPPITLGKVSVYAPDSPWYSSAPSDGVHDYDYYSSVTTHSGNQSTHNTYVDMEIAQKLIWNITKSNEIQIESSAGTFLCLAGDKNNRNVKVTLDNNPCAGWLVVNGNVENKCEYHYIYGGNSEEQQTEGNGQLHYVARKGFTTKYANKDTISQYVDNSVDFDEGDYQFFWQEYTNDCPNIEPFNLLGP